MLRSLVNLGYQLLHEFTGRWWRDRLPPPELFGPPVQRKFRRLKRVVLTDAVSRTLFEDFAAHRQGERGDEEIGWVLLGVRDEEEALVLATLPAGTTRNAGVAHVLFDSDTQALASRIVRQKDRRLSIVGVVHTHPGSLRHPSEGDYHGDSLWVSQLRGGEGVFGIGTADVKGADAAIARQPEPHMQVLGDACFSWYALGQGERRYRKLPIHWTLGPDLARPLHGVWVTLESHAQALDRLCRQQAGVTLNVVSGSTGAVLAMDLKLAEPGSSLRVLFDRQDVQFYLCREGDVSAVNPGESQVDRALYLILAELARHPAAGTNGAADPNPASVEV